MSKRVIAINNTSSDLMIKDLGKVVLADESEDLSELFDITELANSESLKEFINDRKITINNGEHILSIEEAIDYLTISTIYDQKQEATKKYTKNISFLVTTLIGSLSSIVGALIVSTPVLKESIPLFANIHWTVWILFFVLVYIFTSYLVSSQESIKSKVLKSFFRIPLWTELRGFGDQRIARISYWILVFIPIFSYFISDNIFRLEFLNEFSLPLNIKLSFFASWFFSIALILFTIGCPKDLRNINALEKAKSINLLLNEVRSSKLVIEQPVSNDDPILDNTSMGFRAICFLFFLLGILTTLSIFFRSAWYVLKA